MIFLLLAVAVLFLILSLCLIYPTLRWSYEHNTWRGMLSSLLFVSFAPAALVIWYCGMLLVMLFTDNLQPKELLLTITFLLSLLPGVLPFGSMAVKGRRSGVRSQFLTGTFGLAANVSFFAFVLLFMCYGCLVG